MNTNCRALVVPLLLFLPLACNPPPQPIANAGPAQTVAVRQLVRLDGSASMTKATDPGSQITRWAWSFLQLPSGSTAALNHGDIAKPSFVPDLKGDYVLSLLVYDANGSASSSVTITAVDCLPMLTPIAAMPAMPNIGDDVTLTTMVTKGPGCDDRSPYLYAWSIVSVPGNSKAQLLPNAAAPAPTFHVDVAGDYKFAVRVTDQAGRSFDAAITVTAGTCGHNAPSVASIASTPVMPNNGDAVQLTAMVTDPDTDPAGTCKLVETFSYAWTLLGAPRGSTAALNGTGAASPSFVADLPGDYTVRLVVTDNTGLSSPAKDFTVTAGTCGRNAPSVTSIAASPAMPNIGDVVQLAATVQDADTNPAGTCKLTESFSYAWLLLTSPTGSSAKLSAAAATNPWFQPDVPGSYTVRLVVTDNTGLASTATDFVVTTSTCGSNPPLVGAISPSTSAPVLGQTVNFAATVTDADSLAGCGRMETFTYRWTLISQPLGSTARLAFASSAVPTLTPDVAGAYAIQLTVTDSSGTPSDPSQVSVTAGVCGLSAPVAQIGIGGPFTVAAPVAPPPTVAIQVPTGSPVQLDGATSSDPDNSSQCALPKPQTLSFAWRFESLPLGSRAGFNNPQVINPSFTVDVPGIYIANLIVTDSTGLSSTAARVQVNGYNPASTVVSGAGRYTALVLDGANPRIAFQDRYRNGAFVAVCNGATCQSTPIWSIYTIEGGTVGRNISLAVNNGTLYATYWDFGNCQARYAVSTDGGRTWATSAIQANALGCGGGGGNNNHTGSYPSVAVSPVSGSPAVVFSANNLVGGRDEIRYAFCTAGCTTGNPTWAIRAAGGGANGSSSGFTSIAFDPVSRRPGFTFRTDDSGGGNDGVGYVACTGNCENANPTFSAVAWLDQNVGYDNLGGGGGGGRDGTTTSLVVTSTGQPRVAYRDGNNQWLRLASCTNGNCTAGNGWFNVVVDSSGDVGEYASLALSPLAASLDAPRIAYLDRGNGDIKYAQYTAQGYLFARLDGSGNAGGFTSLRLSVNDNPRASYFSSGTASIRYFTSGN